MTEDKTMEKTQILIELHDMVSRLVVDLNRSNAMDATVIKLPQQATRVTANWN